MRAFDIVEYSHFDLRDTHWINTHWLDCGLSSQFLLLETEQVVGGGISHNMCSAFTHKWMAIRFTENPSLDSRPRGIRAGLARSVLRPLRGRQKTFLPERCSISTDRSSLVNVPNPTTFNSLSKT